MDQSEKDAGTIAALVRRLKDTRLPYIVVSLVSNIGGITWSERRGLAMFPPGLR